MIKTSTPDNKEELMYKDIVLSGECFADLNTEIRFGIAEARASGIEIVRLTSAHSAENKRVDNCLLRVIRSMTKSGLAEFCIPVAEINSGSTEAEFLLNKYSRFLHLDTEDADGYYVKL